MSVILLVNNVVEIFINVSKMLLLLRGMSFRSSFDCCKEKLIDIRLFAVPLVKGSNK